MRRIALWAAFLTLLAGIAVTLRPRTGAVSFSPSHPLVTLAPAAPPGWEVRDTPLGPTELATGEVVRILNLDDYFFKTYRRGGTEVGVYVAYWAPGRMDPALVGAHNPDACWVSAGGTILKSNDACVLPGFGPRDLATARFRLFQFPQGREEVVFWHILGGKQVRLADQETSPVLGRLRRFSQSLRLTGFGLAPQEQIFVRISTNRTIDELIKSDLWPRLTASLLPSGIFAQAD